MEQSIVDKIDFNKSYEVDIGDALINHFTRVTENSDASLLGLCEAMRKMNANLETNTKIIRHLTDAIIAMNNKINNMETDKN